MATEESPMKPFEEQTIVEKLRIRAEIRRKIKRRPDGTADRIADLCEEAANYIEQLEEQLKISHSPVWNALTNEMSDELIIASLVEDALCYLKYDDEHPDVGMGMSYRTALHHAEKDVLLAATQWERNIHITDDIRKQALVRIDEARRRK